MITTTEEAKELCKKYDINIKDHKVVIVTGNNSIYLSENIDPADTSVRFYLKGEPVSIKEIQKAKEELSTEESEDFEKDIEKEDEKKSYKRNK